MNNDLHPEQVFVDDQTARALRTFSYRGDCQGIAPIAIARSIGRVEARAGMSALCVMAHPDPEVRAHLDNVETEVRSFFHRDSGDNHHPMSHEERSAYDGIARAFSVNAWISNEELAGRELPRGVDLADVAPATSQEARYAAAKYMGRMEVANDAQFGEIMNRAAQADLKENQTYFKAGDFGWLIGMQALGHGVTWFDDHARFPLKVPHYEFAIDDHHIAIKPSSLDDDIGRANQAAGHSPEVPSV